VYAVERDDADDLSLTAVGSAEHDADLLGGITTIHATGRSRTHVPQPWPYGQTVPSIVEPTDIVAVPYFAWANRGIGPMRVWLPDGRA
jgi:uncharacterized protein